ncbi:MAG: acyl-CoA desaturase [Bacteroidetes bacterium]|nr:acyl-CoA desaturase [Bacteroidota bacterium]
MAKVTFNNKNSVFYPALKSAVDEYFSNHHLRKTGNWKLYVKSAVLIPAAIGIYVSLLAFNMPAYVSLPLCALLGFVLASIGFNIMHDACHGSYSSKRWVNNMMGLSLNVLGGNAFIWKVKHNIIHHTYTNVDGMDDDIAKSPIMRQCHTQKWVSMHRFQHIYVVLVYAISSFAWSYIMDFTKYFKRKIVATPITKMDRKEHIVFWMSKVLNIVYYVVIPVIVVGWKAWAIGFACMHVTMGLTLAIVFQLAHVVESTEFEFVKADDKKKIDEEWAIYQIKTTANFARKNKIISWFVGGLNFQVEHHLFPHISHVHYPFISPIVKQTCEQFNISYNEFPTMSQAIASHFKMMREFGKKPASANSPVRNRVLRSVGTV